MPNPDGSQSEQPEELFTVMWALYDYCHEGIFSSYGTYPLTRAEYLVERANKHFTNATHWIKETD